jgi:hypothetical protein
MDEPLTPYERVINAGVERLINAIETEEDAATLSESLSLRSAFRPVDEDDFSFEVGSFNPIDLWARRTLWETDITTSRKLWDDLPDQYRARLQDAALAKLNLIATVPDMVPEIDIKSGNYVKFVTKLDGYYQASFMVLRTDIGPDRLVDATS